MAARSRGGRGGCEPRARVLTRQARAWELAMAGQSHREIARDLGVSQPAVTKMLKRMAATLFHELATETRVQVARHVGQTDHVYRELMAAWEKSKTDRTRRRHQRVDYDGSAPHHGGTKTVAEASAVAREGDPRFAAHALRALGEKRAVLTLVGGPSLSQPEIPVDQALAALANATLVVLLRLSRAATLSPDWNSPFFASIPADGLLTAEIRRRLQAGTMTAEELRPVRDDADAWEDAQACDETTRRYRLERRARRDGRDLPST